MKTYRECRWLLTNLQYNLAVILAFLHQRVPLTRLLHRENFSDHGMELAGGEPFGKLLPRRLHERAVRTEIRQPESVNAGALRIENASVESRSFAGGGTVDDDASEVAHTADAFRDVLAAEHFENRVDAFATREVSNSSGVIVLLVVDAVLQAELAHSGELLIGGRSPVHFDAENLSDLHSGGADSAGYGMNEDAGSGGLVVRGGEQTGLPVGEVGGKEIYGKRGTLFGSPIFRNGPDEVAMRHGFFGEGGPLRVAHHPSPAGFAVASKLDAGEFAAGSKRRLGSIGVSAVHGHQIGKVQAARFHFHQNLFRRGMRVVDLLQFESLGAAETSDDEGFHAESLTVRWGIRFPSKKLFRWEEQTSELQS